jgi:glycosyltransferase involved in cell wall biosynthesis
VKINDWTQPRPLVSVIVTCHNLAHYLPYALKSIQDSSFADWECVIVDDDSNDDTKEIGENWEKIDERFKYFKTPENLKLSGALNFGVSHSRGRFIIPLDADNELTPICLSRLSQALLSDRNLHGAYGELDIMNHEGRDRRKNVGFPTQFNYFAQMAHLNQAQSSTMVKRELLEKSGGYRDRMWRAEDAHLWCLISSMGFRIEKVTEESTMVYRQRSDSKSAWEYKNFADKDGDWCRDFSWRLASTAQEGAEKLNNKKFLPCVDAIPFGAGGKPTINNGLSWNVHHHDSPLVSIIIPVGEGHKKYVIDALDSCLGQSFPNWEAVVINDTGEKWDKVIGAPYARVFNTKGKEGVGVARNLGIKKSRGSLLLFLDSDDMLMPRTILEMMKVYGSGEHGYIYSNYVEVRSDHTERVVDLPNYNQKLWKGQHPITILISKEDVIKLGSFDEEIKGWEDWDLFVKLAINGICGHRIPLPLFYYRKDTGFRRDESFSKEKELLPILKKRYDKYYEGDGVDFMSCCGGNGDVILEVKKALKRAAEMSGIDLYPDLTVLRDEVERDFRLEYIGDKTGAITFLGADGRRIYRGGNNDHDRFIDVRKEYQEDLNRLLGSGEWRIVRNANQ